MSTPPWRSLLRPLSAPVLAGALVLAGAPLLAPAPASAVVPTLPGTGCLVNAVQTLTSAGSPTTLLDLASVTKTISVADTGNLSWLRVRTDLVHARVSDLVVTLTSPAGSVITLTDSLGGNHANSFNGTWWDDASGAQSATGSVTEADFANGALSSVAPAEPLEALRGESVTGNWVLTITDATLGSGTGSLTDWVLEYATRSGGAADSVDLGTGNLPGAMLPPGQSHSFTYDLTHAPAGSLQDVIARFDIDGPTSAVYARLVSPSGGDVTLTNGNGLLSSLFSGGTTLSDHAAVLPGLGPIGGLLGGLLTSLKLAAPQEPLSALTGGALAGVWTLRLENLGAVPITLNSWGLDLTGSTCGLDGSLTPLTQLPTSLPLGSTFAYAVSVTNTRLAPLDLSSLGLTLPAGVDLVSVTSTLGTCAGLTCALGTLLPGAQAVVVYVLKAVTDGAKNITVTLSHLGLDALPLDNLLSLLTVVNQTATTPGGGGSTTPATDTTAPGLVMLLGKDKLKTVAKKGVLSAAGWTEGGRLSLTVKLPGKVAKKLKLPKVIGKRVLTMTKAGTAKLRLHVSKKAAKKLLTTQLRVRIIVKGQLKDAAGNVGKASAGATYKP